MPALGKIGNLGCGLSDIGSTHTDEGPLIGKFWQFETSAMVML